MALICMASFDTLENMRTGYTMQTLQSLLQTVDFKRHRLALIDNGSCEETVNLLQSFTNNFPEPVNVTLILNQRNIGTAKAINKGIRLRKSGEHVIKMDNDITFGTAGWADEMEDCIARLPKIGLVGLKRMDLLDHPDHSNSYYRSQLVMLPHQPGQPWIVCEKINHMMGSCQLLSSALLDKIGGFEQPAVYGYDDTIVCYKSNLLSFLNVYLPHIPITHLDAGGMPEHEWKKNIAKEHRKEVDKMLEDLKKHRRLLYHDIFTELG